MDNNRIEALLMKIIDNQAQMQSDITEIKDKMNAVFNQTADLTETKDNFAILSKDVKFIKHKLHETE